MNEAFKLIERDLTEALSKAKVSSLITDATYSAGFGEVVRFAPPATGTRLILPAPNLAQLDSRITAVCEAATGALSVEVVDGTINGATTLAYLAGIGTVEFVLTSTGWYAWSVSLVDLAFASSTSVVYDATTRTFQRAALTGEVTAAQNVNAAVVARATNFQTAPWTGPHQFNGELRLGTLHTDANSGAINVTLTAGSTRLLLSHSTGNHTLGTVSGCAEGRLLFVEFLGTGVHTITHDATGADAFACPGNVNLVITGRGGYIAVGRVGANANWKVIATTN